MTKIQWLMMFLTTMLIVEAYDRKFEILGKYENSSPSLVSFIDRSFVISNIFQECRHFLFIHETRFISSLKVGS